MMRAREQSSEKWQKREAPLPGNNAFLKQLILIFLERWRKEMKA